MARFYFQPDIREATFEDFADLARADLDTARQVAARSARAFLSAEAAKGRSCQCCCVIIDTSAGLTATTILPENVVDGTIREATITTENGSMLS